MKKAVFFVLFLVTLSKAETKLENIQYSIKKNGIMVSLDFTNPISDDNIIGWKSDRGWLYLTLLGVKAPENMIPSTGFNGVVKDIVLDDFDESIQIAILVGRPIAGYDIVNSQNEPTTVIFIHTQMRRSEVYSLKKHIEKEGSSLFGQVQTSKFPEYNTNFESAFKSARLELGPNSIFRYDGKLYTTNHPLEEKRGIKDALRDKPLDMDYVKEESRFKSIDGENYTDLKINEEDEESIASSKEKLKTQEYKKSKKNDLYDRNVDESSIKTFFSDLFNAKKTSKPFEFSTNNVETENEIDDLEQKILELEEQLYSKEQEHKVEQKKWESRAEERQNVYRSQLQKLEKNLVDTGKKQPNQINKNKEETTLFLDNGENIQEKYHTEVLQLEKQLKILESDLKRRDELLAQYENARNRDKEKIEKKYFDKEVLLKSELEELSKNLEQRSALLEEEKKRIENLAIKKQNRINKRKMAELVSQLGRLEDEIEEKDKTLLSTKSSMNKEIEKMRNEYFEKEIILRDDLEKLSMDLNSREKELDTQRKLIEQEKKKNRNIYLSQKIDLDKIESEQNKKFSEQEKILAKKKRELKKLKNDREFAYKKRAQDLEFRLMELESEIAKKDRDLFEEKQNWEMLSLKEVDNYKTKIRDLENDLFIIEKSIKNKDKKIYAEKDKWRLLALERQKKIDEFEPKIEQFNSQLKSIREELLSDLYDKKVELNDQTDHKQNNLLGFFDSFKKSLSKQEDKKEDWIDSVYNELEDSDFSFQEYFTLALPNDSESLDKPPNDDIDKKWRETLPENKRDRYKSAVKDPVFEYYYNGGIRVETNMAGIPIYINGKHVGETPLNSPIQVEPGWHQISGFSPLYKQVAESEGLFLVGNDPIIKNNQLFGSKTVFVESGKVANVSLKFNRMGNTPKKWKELKGGWLVGFPMILILFSSITWGL